MDESFSRKNTELMNDSNQDSEIKASGEDTESPLKSIKDRRLNLMPNIPGLQHLSKKILGLQ